jgi:hypothetical protein
MVRDDEQKTKQNNTMRQAAATADQKLDWLGNDV